MGHDITNAKITDAQSLNRTQLREVQGTFSAAVIDTIKQLAIARALTEIEALEASFRAKGETVAFDGEAKTYGLLPNEKLSGKDKWRGAAYLEALKEETAAAHNLGLELKGKGFNQEKINAAVTAEIKGKLGQMEQHMRAAAMENEMYRLVSHANLSPKQAERLLQATEEVAGIKTKLGQHADVIAMDKALQTVAILTAKEKVTDKDGAQISNLNKTMVELAKKPAVQEVRAAREAAPKELFKAVSLLKEDCTTLVLPSGRIRDTQRDLTVAAPIPEQATTVAKKPVPAAVPGATAVPSTAPAAATTAPLKGVRDAAAGKGKGAGISA